MLHRTMTRKDTAMKRPSALFALAVLPLAAAWLSAAGLRSSTTHAPQDVVTFSEHVAPILYQNCVTCHRPGEAAPFSLISYEDAVKRGPLMVDVTKSRYMPPWHAEPGFGDFADERRLTDAQIDTIARWVAGRMPRGDAARMPKVPSFTDGWQLGKPDLVLEMPEAFDVPASGPDIYRNFAIPTGLTEDKYVRAVEFRPSARQVVHHALFQFAKATGVADLNGVDGKPGFAGAMPVRMVPAFAPAGDLGGWAVGTTPRFLPENLSLTMNKGSAFILQLHLHPTGKPEHERSTIGLYFSDTPAPRKVREISAPALFGALANIDIPAGETAYVVKGTARTFANMRVYTALAHAHYLGKEFKAIATLPDGTTKPLLWIRDWNFNWQDRYVYKQPVDLPKGSKIDVTITYDNSADNPHNPCNPPRRVQFGLQSFDEMGGVVFQAMTTSDDDEIALDNFNAAIAKAVVNQVANNDTIKRLQEQQRQFKAGIAAPPVGCGSLSPTPGVGIVPPFTLGRR
jgi:mono/diheme cytochrome c family protein